MTGLNASHHITLANAEGLRELVRGIRDSYASWDGVKEWEGAYRDLRLSARHDGRAHVLLSVRVGPGWRGPRWAVELPVEIEAGEETVRLADAIESFLDG